MAGVRSRPPCARNPTHGLVESPFDDAFASAPGFGDDGASALGFGADTSSAQTFGGTPSHSRARKRERRFRGPLRPHSGRSLTPQSSDINDLPDEILLQVLRQVSNGAVRFIGPKPGEDPPSGLWRSTLTHALVCKKWAHLIDQSQATVIAGTSWRVPQSRLFADISRFHQLTQLHVHGSPAFPLTDFAVGAICASFPGLRKLALLQGPSFGSAPEEASQKGSVSGEAFQALLECNANLMSVFIDRILDVPDNYNVYDNLKVLRCEAVRSVSWGAFKGMPSLRILKLRGSVRYIPPSLGDLVSLELLDLEVDDVTQLPLEIGALRKLRCLRITSYGLVSLPASLSSLLALKSLSLDCLLANQVPPLPPQLRKVEIACSEYASPDPLLGLSHLRKLHLRHSFMNHAAAWETLSSLEELVLDGNCGDADFMAEQFEVADIIDVDPGLCRLPNVKSLRVHGLCSLPGNLGSMTSLRTLELDAIGDEDLPESLHGLCNLKSLRITSCHRLAGLPEGLRRLSGLETLEIIRCKGVQITPAVAQLKQLRVLRMDVVRLQQSAQFLSRLTRLELLHIGHCMLRKLPRAMEGLGRLKVLSLVGLKFLRHLPWSMMRLRRLQSLHIFKCPGIGFPRGHGVHVFGGHPAICSGYLGCLIEDANSGRAKKQSCWQDRGKCPECMSLSCMAWHHTPDHI